MKNSSSFVHDSLQGLRTPMMDSLITGSPNAGEGTQVCTAPASCREEGAAGDESSDH